MNWKAISSKRCIKTLFLDIAISVQGVLLVLLLLSEEWGSVHSSVGIMNLYSYGVVVFALFILLYKACVNMEFNLSSIDFLILAFFVVVFVSGVQSDFDYFTHRALFSWVVIGASYCVFRMIGFKQVSNLLEILFCTTLCSRTVYFLEQFLSGIRRPDVALSLCMSMCVCIGPWLVTKARSRWEKLFYMVGTIVLAFGLNVMSVFTIIVIVFVFSLLVPYVRVKKARRLIRIASAVAFMILVVANLDYGFVMNRVHRLRTFWGNGPGFYMSLQDSFVLNDKVKTLTDSVYQVILYEFGILGLCFFLVVCFSVFWSCVEREDFGIAVAILALSVYLLNVPYSDTSLIVLWGFMGTGCSHSMDVGDSRIGERARPFLLKLIIVVLAVIFLFQYVTYQIKAVQVQGHIMLGDRLYSAGLFSQALENYRKAVVLVCKNPVAHMMLGKTFLVMDMYGEAALLFERALEYGSRSKAAYVGLAESYLGLGKRSLALRILQEGTEFHPDITPEVVLKHTGEQSTNDSISVVKLSEIRRVEYRNGVISCEVVLENQGQDTVDVVLAALVLDFEEKVYSSVRLENMIIQAGSSSVLQDSINISLPKGIYVLKIFTRYGDETDEIIGYFVVS